MNNNGPLIKWPGGKQSEIQYIDHLIPEYDRYIEPFFGGGALFFHLQPHKAVINDISTDLMSFYRLIRDGNPIFFDYLYAYFTLFSGLIEICELNYSGIYNYYQIVRDKQDSPDLHSLTSIVSHIVSKLDISSFEMLVQDKEAFSKQLQSNFHDKCIRTVKNEQKKPFSEEDLKNNLITGFASGCYMYFRDIYNDIHLQRVDNLSEEYSIANFYFIREYCYGSMFRYNRKGEFNIPYGGMSYNHKDFLSKIDCIADKHTRDVFDNTSIYNLDFEEFFSSVELTEKDFMFLDPPYDSDFSNYEGNDFTQMDQIRLSEALKKTKARFILIIKNTDFIYSLYKDTFNISYFDKTYTYNVRQRNDRETEHLIITNLDL